MRIRPLYRRVRATLESRRQQALFRQFKRNGYKPWSPGYDVYRAESLERALQADRFYQDLGTPRFGYRLDERFIEYPWLMHHLPRGPLRMLDAGSALNHEVVLNHPALRDKKLFITTLAPEGVAFFQRGISYVYDDLRDPCFRDAYFDAVACISTLEHVGLDNTRKYTTDPTKAEESPEDFVVVVKKLRELLKPGGTLYVSVPFGAARNHGWFQVFNAPMLSRLIDAFAPAKLTEEIFQYSDDRWHASTRDRAKDCTCFDIGEQKTYDPDFAAFSRAIACLVLTR